MSAPWLTLSGTANGDLSPGQSVDIGVDVDPFAAGLSGADDAVSEVVFRDLDAGAVIAQRSITVSSIFDSDDSGGSDSNISATGSSGGWTTFTPSADTRQVFVSSSSGDDGNDGLSQSTAKRTIAAGRALLRHGYPDWLLLERGGTWHEGLGQWKTSGRSSAEPMLVSTYGPNTARPRLLTGSGPGVWTNGGGGSPPTIDHVAIVGLEFFPDTYVGVGEIKAVEWLQPSTDFLLEDCYCHGYATNLVIMGYGGRHRNQRLRRNVVADSYSTNPAHNSQGLYVSATDGFLLEECVFDHNGWNENVPGAIANIFRHNVYIQNGNSACVVRGNIFSNGGSHGVQARSGGMVVNNLFIRNSIALAVGAGNTPDPGGVTADVRGNVFLDGKNIDPANVRGWGMTIANVASGRVTYNVIANNTMGGFPVPIDLQGNHMGDNGPDGGIHNLQISDNFIYNWGGTVFVEGDSSKLTNIQLLRNDVQNTITSEALLNHFVTNSTTGFDSSGNHFFSQTGPNAWTLIGSSQHTIGYWMTQVGDTTSVPQQILYTQPDRSVATYNAFLGGAASHDAFMAQARQQSWANWRREYMAIRVARYIRRGFLTASP